MLCFLHALRNPPRQGGAAVLVSRGLSCGSLGALDAALNRDLWAHEAAAKLGSPDLAFSRKPASSLICPFTLPVQSTTYNSPHAEVS